MMSEHRPDRNVTLEDLLRLKRAERPPAEFWASFEHELRTRQLAAAVDKRRWWFSLPRIFAGFARFQVPMGAAAVLAVTFLSLRDYREPGFEVSYQAPTLVAPAVEQETVSRPAPSLVRAEPNLRVLDLVPTVESEIVVRRTEQVAAASSSGSTEQAPSADEALSPSARSIAANLAAVESELSRLLAGHALSAPVSQQREPLAQLTSPRDARRERLFAYDAELASYSAERDEARAGERIASRINERELYDSVRRLSGGGDRLTLKF